MTHKRTCFLIIIFIIPTTLHLIAYPQLLFSLQSSLFSLLIYFFFDSTSLLRFNHFDTVFLRPRNHCNAASHRYIELDRNHMSDVMYCYYTSSRDTETSCQALNSMFIHWVSPLCPLAFRKKNNNQNRSCSTSWSFVKWWTEVWHCFWVSCILVELNRVRVQVNKFFDLTSITVLLHFARCCRYRTRV